MKILKENKLYKVLSLNAISVGVSFILGLFSTKIISHFLGTAGMASFGSFRNFTAMIKSLATLGINNSIVKLFIDNKGDKKELSVIYSTFFWLFLVVSVVLSILVLLFSGAISIFLFAGNEYHLSIQIFALALPLIVMNTFWMAVYNGLQAFRKIVAIQIISNIVIFGITVLFVWNGDVNGGLLSIALSEVAMVLVTYFFIRNNHNYFRFDLQKIISKKYFSIIRNFSIMALLSAVIAPLTLIFIRNHIIDTISINEAGIWDGVNRLSGFYMGFFNTGLALYYMPKLSSLKTDAEFQTELKVYFKTLVPLFALVLIGVYLFRSLIVDVAFTADFNEIESIVIWQLLGDLFRIMTLAFGFQILVKTMMKEYFIIEIAFNVFYFLLSFWLIKTMSIEGAVQAYFFSTFLSFLMVLFLFRKVILKKD